MRVVARLLLLLVLVVSAGSAGENWKKKPPGEWASEDALELLTDSPWAKRVTVYHPQNVRLTGNVRKPGLPRASREIDMQNSPDPAQTTQALELKGILTFSAIYVVRWSSAQIVQKALEELAKKEPTLREAQAPPPTLSDRHWVLTVRTERPPRYDGQWMTLPTERPVPYEGPGLFGELRNEELLELAELRAGGKVRLKPDRAQRHGLGTSEGVSFFFPRQLNRQPALPPGTKWAELFFRREKGVELKARFKLEEMQVNQQPDY